MLQIILFFLNNISMIISPCISICKTDPSTDIVMVVVEIMKKKKWKLDNTTDDWKKENISTIKKVIRLAIGKF